MLGANMMIRPVFEAGATECEVVLPGNSEEWVNMWTGDVYSSAADATYTVSCAVGFPAVFYRNTAEWDISSILGKYVVTEITQEVF
jgi:alpha-glucosidase (family GH31 glycosyl hydrolase)